MALGRDDLDTLRAALRNAGLRATRSRIAVLHALRSAGSPASHGEVVARSAHAHFMCTGCGSVECLPDLEYVITRSRAPRAVRLKRVEIHLRGACDACM